MTAVGAAVLSATAGTLAIQSVVLFVLWVLVLVWIYNIAKRKGRHALGWLFLGLFFSLITLVVVALLPSKRVTDTYR